MRSRSIVLGTPLRVGAVLSVLVLIIPIGGCDAPRAEATMQSSNQMKEMILGAQNYQTINEEWPDDLEAARELIDSDLDVLMQNPLTGANPGYEYVKPSSDDDPATTVIMYQLRDGERDTSLRVGYADGHVAEFASPE